MANSDPDPSTTLRLTRTFAAPRDQVFRTWTDPEALTTWWGPEGYTTPSAEVDLRVGGRYRLAMRKMPDGEIFYLSGTYREVRPPERLVYTCQWEHRPALGEMLVTVEFRERGGRTEVILTHERFASVEDRAGHERGWSGSLDKLETLLAPRSATLTPEKGADTMSSEREQFLQAWEAEFVTTRKLIAAIPEARREFQPHPRSMTARSLAWHLVRIEPVFIEGCLSGRFEFAKGPDAPASIAEILAIYERQHRELVERLRAADAGSLAGTVNFFVAPKQMGQVPIMMILWRLLLMHTVHHRGQLSAYLRAMGEKVPSVYGPSADEPWF